MRRNKLPSMLFETQRFRRPINLGIQDYIERKKEDKEMEQNENDLRIQRLGINEEYFNNR